jgi:hypothetical protein
VVAEEPLWLVAEVKTAWWAVWPMLSGIFLMGAQIQVAAMVPSTVRRALLLAPDSLSSGSLMASIG